VVGVPTARPVALATAEPMLLGAHCLAGVPVLAVEAGLLTLGWPRSVLVTVLAAGPTRDPLDAVFPALAPFPWIARRFGVSGLGRLPFTGSALWD